MATPGEMLERLDHAIAGPRGKKRTVLSLPVPNLLGFKGRYVGRDVVAVVDDTPVLGPHYGYTRRQCKKMRVMIRTDLALNAAHVVAAAEAETPDWYTGDVK